MSAVDVTLLTVSYNSAPFLARNAAITRQLNPQTPYTWLVCENSPAGSPQMVQEGITHPDFRVLPGPPPPAADTAGGPSYHHAAGLHAALANMTTRYVIIIDPDLFVVRPNWIVDTVTYARQKQLSIFGTPYHPYYATKYRYFPAAYWMLIDLERLPPAELDFTPRLAEKETIRAEAMATLKTLPWPWYTRALMAFLGPKRSEQLFQATKRRKKLGTAADTGWLLFQRYAQHPQHRWESFWPVFNPSTEANERLPQYGDYGVGKGWLPKPWVGKLTDALLPEALRWLPSRQGGYSRQGFQDLGFSVSPRAWGWDEFLWQQQPFAFHVRSFHKALRAAEATGEAAEQPDVFSLLDAVFPP